MIWTINGYLRNGLNRSTSMVEWDFTIKLFIKNDSH